MRFILMLKVKVEETSNNNNNNTSNNNDNNNDQQQDFSKADFRPSLTVLIMSVVVVMCKLATALINRIAIYNKVDLHDIKG
eukprot:UN08888